MADFYQIGKMLAGSDNENDRKGAIEWFIKSAALGNRDAEWELAVFHSNNGAHRIASQWCRKAAKQGHTEAQFTMGYMYHFGCFFAKDEDRAIMWYKRAAKQGHVKSQCNLGVLFETVKGISAKQRRDSAAAWYNKAIAAGDTDAKSNLDMLVREVEEKKRARQEGKAQPEAPVVERKSPASASAPAQAPMDTGQDAMASSTASNCCVICLVQPKQVVLMPCQHLALCQPCANRNHRQNGTCPVCRQVTTSLMSVFNV